MNEKLNIPNAKKIKLLNSVFIPSNNGISIRTQVIKDLPHNRAITQYFLGDSQPHKQVPLPQPLRQVYHSVTNPWLSQFDIKVINQPSLDTFQTEQSKTVLHDALLNAYQHNLKKVNQTHENIVKKLNLMVVGDPIKKFVSNKSNWLNRFFDNAKNSIKNNNLSDNRLTSSQQTQIAQILTNKAIFTPHPLDVNAFRRLQLYRHANLRANPAKLSQKGIKLTFKEGNLVDAYPSCAKAWLSKGLPSSK